jgi:hypothetical protein
MVIRQAMKNGVFPTTIPRSGLAPRTFQDGALVRLTFLLTFRISFHIEMQDKHKAILDLSEGIDDAKSVTYLALFDGHGGMHCGFSRPPF